MEFWQPAQLSAAGRIVLHPGEIELAYASDASLLDAQRRPTRCTSGILTVTTHRLVWTAPDSRTSLALPLQHVVAAGPGSVEDRSGLSAKGKLQLRVGPAGAELRVELKQRKDLNGVRTALVRAVERREWERIAAAEARRVAKEREANRFDPSKVGIAGIMAKEKAKEAERSETMGSAFTDLRALMDHARELVAIAGRFKIGAESGDGADDAEQSEIVELLGNLGIASPVTRNATGNNTRLYHEQLARQLAEFLARPLDHLGGVATLTDVYCMYNRARNTTELVAPEDVLAACKLFPKLGLPYELKRLQSGALAVMKGDFGGQASAERLLAMARERGSLTPLDLVGMYAIPLQVALVQLQDAERRGTLCRDDQGIGEESGGVRFFPNLFTLGFT